MCNKNIRNIKGKPVVGLSFNIKMNKIHSLIIILFIGAIVISDCLSAPNQSYSRYPNEKGVMLVTNIQSKELDAFIENAINVVPIPGLSVMITNQNDNIYSMQYGQGATENSPFALGSTSKAITATAVLMLLEEYNIELYTPIWEYLTWIDTEYGITIKDLLNHTSGISTYETIDNLKYSGSYGDFEYSNANYNLLAEIIETITGNPFSDYVDKRIFSILEMDNSFALSNDNISSIVQGHKAYFGLLFPCRTTFPDKTTWIQAPSGYLCASPENMSVYLRFMLDYSRDKQQLLSLVQNTGVQVNDSPAIEGIYNNSGIYGLGWIWKNVSGIDILYHTGKLSNFCSLSVLIPQKNIGISVMCNMGDFLVGTNQIEKLYEGIISILINHEDIPIIQKNTYLKQHIFINMSLLFLVFLCLLPAILYRLTGAIFYPTTLNCCVFTLIHIIIPIILIRLFPILGITYEVATDFAPDILLILLICSVILFSTGAWKLVLIVFCE